MFPFVRIVLVLRRSLCFFYNRSPSCRIVEDPENPQNIKFQIGEPTKTDKLKTKLEVRMLTITVTIPSSSPSQPIPSFLNAPPLDLPFPFSFTFLFSFSILLCLSPLPCMSVSLSSSFVSLQTFTAEEAEPPPGATPLEEMKIRAQMLPAHRFMREINQKDYVQAWITLRDSLV